MKKVYLYIFLAAFFYGTMETALKLAGNELDPLQLTFLRFFIAGLVFLPIAIGELRRNRIRLTRKDYLYLWLLGVMNVPFFTVAFQLGIMWSNASTAAVIFSVNPVFTMIFAHFMAGELFTKQKLKVIIIGIAGIILMMRPWDIQGGNTLHGMLLSLTAAVFFGLYTVMGKKITVKIGIMPQTSLSFIFGSLTLLMVMFFIGSPVIAGVKENIWIVLYTSFAVTCLGYLFYFLAIKNSDAVTGSITFFLKIVIAPIIAVIVLGEHLMWNTYIGIVLMLLASFMNIRQGMWQRDVERKQAEETQPCEPEQS
ncbi:MAG: DMT family transporter [Firmicutes bacterium]|nr:DMT family transporter [Bacillota bacterium]